MAVVDNFISTKSTARYDGSEWVIREIKLIPYADLLESGAVPSTFYQLAESPAFTPAIGAAYSVSLPSVTLRNKEFRYTGNLDDGTLEVDLLYRGLGEVSQLRYGASVTQVQTDRDIDNIQIKTTHESLPQIHYVAVMDPLQTIRASSAFTLNNAPTPGLGWQHPQKLQDTYHRTTNSFSLPSFTVQDTVGQFLITRIEISDIIQEAFLAPNGWTFSATFEIQRNIEGWINTSIHEVPDEYGNIRPIEDPQVNGPDELNIVTSEHYPSTDWSLLPFWFQL